jgi:hypothetical protein
MRGSYSGGPSAVFTNWSAYVLMGVGTGTMLHTSHAMAADHAHYPAAEA